MSYGVVVTARARADAIEAFRWIAEGSPDAAARWYVGLEKAIAKLTTMPERHPIAEDESEQLGITLRQVLYGRRLEEWRFQRRSQDSGNSVVNSVCRDSAVGSLAIQCEKQASAPPKQKGGARREGCLTQANHSVRLDDRARFAE